MAQLLKMLPLFNEIEKILDNVNPDDLLEPEVKSTKKGKKRKPKSKENDYSDLEIKEINIKINEFEEEKRTEENIEKVKTEE